MNTTINAKRPIGGTHAVLTDEQRAELDRLVVELSGHLFTPRLRNGRRIGVVLECADYNLIRGCGRGLGSRGIVTDLNTDNQYEIVGATCGLNGCECDSIAIKRGAEQRKVG
jgi:hypothetical protein